MVEADPKDIRRARRITIVSRSNGFSGLSLGVLAVIVSLAVGDLPALLASLGICAAASLEITGSFRAARHEPVATRFLVASQAVSLLSVLALVIRLTVAINPSSLLRWIPAVWSEPILILYSGPGEAEAWLQAGVRFSLALLAVVIAIFEAGVATYYATSAGTFARLAAARSRGD